MKFAERLPRPIAAWLPLLLLPVLVPIATSNTTLIGLDAITSDGTRAIKLVVLGVLALAASIGWAVWAIRENERVVWHKSLWLGVGVLAIAVWSTLASTSPIVSLFGSYEYRQGLVTMLVLATCGFLAVQLVRTPAQARLLAAAVAIGGVPVAAYGLLQVFGLDPARWNAPAWAMTRGFSTLGNPDPYAGYLVLPAALALGLALSAQLPLRRAGWWASFALMSTAVLLSQVRAAWLGLLLAIVVIVAFAVARKLALTRVDWIALGLAAVLLLGAGLWAGDAIAGRIDDLFSGDRSAGSNRIDLWEASVRALGVSPLLGTGPDSFRYSYYATRSNKHDLQGGHRTLADDAHLLPVQIGVTLGIPAMLAALALFGVLIAMASKAVFSRKGSAPFADATYAAWLAAVLGYLLYTMLGPSAMSPNLVMALGFGVLIAPFAEVPKGQQPSVTLGLAASLAFVTLVAAVAGVSGFVGEIDYTNATRQTDPAKALPLVTKAVDRSPWTYEYRVTQADTLAALAETAPSTEASAAAITAVQAYDDLIAFAPAEYLTYVACGSALLFMPQLPDADSLALQIAKGGLDICPSGLDLRTIGATAAMRLGQWDEAVNLLKDDWNSTLKWSRPGITYAYALAGAGRVEEAMDVAQILAQEYPEDADVQTLLTQLAASPAP